MSATGGSLLAWIEYQANDGFRAAYVGADAMRREPATKLLDSQDDAKGWVEREASALGLPVTWLARPPA